MFQTVSFRKQHKNVRQQLKAKGLDSTEPYTRHEVADMLTEEWQTNGKQDPVNYVRNVLRLMSYSHSLMEPEERSDWRNVILAHRHQKRYIEKVCIRLLGIFS